MGFLDRLKESKDTASGRPTELPLTAPTRISVAVSAGDPEALVVYVADPSLILGQSSRLVPTLREMILTSSDDVPIAFGQDNPELREMLKAVPFLHDAQRLITPDFERHWCEVGARAVRSELALGIRLSAGKINSVTSAALVGATLDAASLPETLLAQYFVRCGYLTARLLEGGPTSAAPTIGQLILHPRLFLLSGETPISAQVLLALLAAAPFPRAVRDAWEYEFVKCRGDAEAFAKTADELNRAFWKLWGVDRRGSVAPAAD